MGGGGGKKISPFLSPKKNPFFPSIPSSFSFASLSFRGRNGFINHATRARVSLLGPCFKTGRTRRFVGVCQASRAPASSERKCCVFFLEAFPPRASPPSLPVPPRSPRREKREKRTEGEGEEREWQEKKTALSYLVFAYDCETHGLDPGRGIRVNPGQEGERRKKEKGRTFSPPPPGFSPLPRNALCRDERGGYLFKPGIDADTFETSAK